MTLRKSTSGHVALAILFLSGPTAGHYAVAWDGLQAKERRFEGVVIEGEDPIEEMDKKRAEIP